MIDPDLRASLTNNELTKNCASNDNAQRSIIIFLKNASLRDQLIKDFANDLTIKLRVFDSLPIILIISGAINTSLIESLANHPSVAQLSLASTGQEEFEVSEASALLQSSSIYPMVSSWWDHGYNGKGGVIGLLDSGVANEHPGLHGKQIYTRKEIGSKYENFKNGVRSPHGTGIACIYAGVGSEEFPNELGVAYGAQTIIAGLSGESFDNQEEVIQTLSTLDWMLDRAEVRPHIINYSIGHSLVGCEQCPDWSGLARIVDYVINHYRILWVKSAGNNGFVPNSSHSSMTIPADNYNGITVSNMDASFSSPSHLCLYSNRSHHRIFPSSSRGPTKNGRKKPDLAAPGHNTWTCAPDPNTYSFEYSDKMSYREGYRFMGGTSSAAPHVGASILLLRQAGIDDPLAQKALLINSADAWTDNNQPGPNDPDYPQPDKHYPIMGSEWNKTYGWGYLNMETAFEQRHYIKMGYLTSVKPQKVYFARLPVGAKITLVHERRVGYHLDGRPWQLSHLKLEVRDKHSHKLLFSDNSAIDTVHQVANCTRQPGEIACTNKEPIDALIIVSLVNKTIDGSQTEPFALSSSEATILIGSEEKEMIH